MRLMRRLAKCWLISQGTRRGIKGKVPRPDAIAPVERPTDAMLKSITRARGRELEALEQVLQARDHCPLQVVELDLGTSVHHARGKPAAVNTVEGSRHAPNCTWKAAAHAMGENPTCKRNDEESDHLCEREPPPPECVGKV